MLQRPLLSAAALVNQMAIRFRPDPRLQIHTAAMQNFADMARGFRREAEFAHDLREPVGEIGPAAFDICELLAKFVAVCAFRRFAKAFRAVAAGSDQIASGSGNIEVFQKGRCYSEKGVVK